MEYIYAAMLIHKTGKKIDEPSLRKVLESVGVKPDETKIKALIAALSDVDIDKAIKEAALVPVAAEATKPEAKAEKKEAKEEKKVSEEEAAAGLSALFG